MKVYDNITATIGHTPLVRLNRITADLHAEVLVKLESFNPLGSVKDRIAAAMIDDAELSGRLSPGGVLIEPTSGNTGVGLAMVAAARGYRLIITMPETMSMERRKLLLALGAHIVLTPGSEGMPGAIRKAEELLQETPGAIIPGQFVNPANPRIHELTTGPEIWEDTDGKVDVLVAGVGTGGTITGAGRFLKGKKPGIILAAVEPKGSAVLSGSPPGPHKIQGIGAGFKPEVLDPSLLDLIIPVEEEAAGDAARRLAREEGIFAGISSGAALWAAMHLAHKKEHAGQTIVAILPDTGERYLSTWLFEFNG